MLGDPLGTHRVLEPAGVLPQTARRLDNDTSKRFDTEIVVKVRTLNIDAASFRQMEGRDPQASGGASVEDAVAATVMRTVAERGKQHNPVTGSGGMLLGEVVWVGAAAAQRGFAAGDRIATLASLSLTPLCLDRVLAVRRASAQVDVEGSAIVFLSAPMTKVATDLPERLLLAVYDVCGAAPQIARLVAPDHTVVILGGGGKSGLIVCAEARRRAGPGGLVVGVESHAPFAAELVETGFCDHVVIADATDPVRVRQAVLHVTKGKEADVVVSCVNVGGAEMSAALLTRPRGKAYFFAMSTSFTAAALGAEGMGRDIDMYIGNGYAEGHAEHTLALLRSCAPLEAALRKRFG